MSGRDVLKNIRKQIGTRKDVRALNFIQSPKNVNILLILVNVQQLEAQWQLEITGLRKIIRKFLAQNEEEESETESEHSSDDGADVDSRDEPLLYGISMGRGTCS